MKSRLYVSLLAAAALLAGSFSIARAADDSTIKFSDPAKPGTVKVVVGHGSIRIRGADVSEVSVKSEAKAVSNKATRKDGLRVLSTASSYTLNEKDNVVVIDAVSEMWRGGGGHGDFTVTVPRNTNITVTSTFGGADVNIADLDGDLEIKANNGDIRLDGIGGGVLVESMNGEIRANVRQLRDNKPLSFTSLHGQVIVRVPPTAKANVLLRTQNGSILTDFDDKALVTKTENTPIPSKPRGERSSNRTPKPPTPPTPAPAASGAPAAPEAAPKPAAAARTGVGLSEKDKDDIRRAAQDVARSAQEIARSAQEATKDALEIAKDAVHATKDGITMSMTMKSPAMVMTSLTGGSKVTGTLNGGGPEISIATMNGDVVLRQLDPSKDATKK
jgi:uncharacterized membrane protein